MGSVVPPHAQGVNLGSEGLLNGAECGGHEAVKVRSNGRTVGTQHAELNPVSRSDVIR